MNTIEAHTILGLRPGVNLNDVKKAYRKRAKETHPDRTGVIDDREFKLVNSAYEYLKDSNLPSSSFSNNKPSENYNRKSNSVVDDSDLAHYIRTASSSDLLYRFCADIDESYNRVNSKYVLIKGVGIRNDWGVILVAYNLPLHRDIVSEYKRRTDTRNITVLGGGRLEINWIGIGAPLFRTYGESGDYGKPKSLLAVKTCLDTFIHCNFGWAKEHVNLEVS